MQEPKIKISACTTCINRYKRCLPCDDGTCGGYEELVIQPERPDSNREQRYVLLANELKFWGIPITENSLSAIKVISSELSWRMVTRIVNRLRNRRGEV